MITNPRQPFVEQRSGTLLVATQRAVWPLVKLLLYRGVGHAALADLLKKVFVQVATREFPLHGKRDTDSRIHILTGIHRRDVKRLRAEADAHDGASNGAAPSDEAGPTATEITLSARVVALWTGMPEYVDAAGHPRPLARLSRQEGEPSFEALVRSVSRDVRPRALLDEWIRRGAVSIDAEDRVCLDLNAFMAQKGLDEKAFYYAQNIHDHLAAVAHNMLGEGEPMLERCVYYGGLTAEAKEELSRLARDEGMKVLQLLNRRALELKSRDADEPHAKFRVNFGVYFYAADTTATPRQPHAPDTPDPADS